MSVPFLGQIQAFAFPFAPVGWAKCDGQTLQISENEALFSLIGVKYGGDGQTTFKLPDLRGRVPIHYGSGMGLANIAIAAMIGSEAHTLLVAELPSHDHPFSIDCNNSAGDVTSAVSHVPAPSSEDVYQSTANGKMLAMRTQATGGQGQIKLRGPELSINFCIALDGVYPSQN